jgi:hypothetical protein
MSDPISPKPAAEATLAPAAELARLCRRIEGSLDGALLLPEEGAVLPATIERGRRCLDGADRQAPPRHTAARQSAHQREAK